MIFKQIDIDIPINEYDVLNCIISNTGEEFRYFYKNQIYLPTLDKFEGYYVIVHNATFGKDIHRRQLGLTNSKTINLYYKETKIYSNITIIPFEKHSDRIAEYMSRHYFSTIVAETLDEI